MLGDVDPLDGEGVLRRLDARVERVRIDIRRSDQRERRAVGRMVAGAPGVAVVIAAPYSGIGAGDLGGPAAELDRAIGGAVAREDEVVEHRGGPIARKPPAGVSACTAAGPARTAIKAATMRVRHTGASLSGLSRPLQRVSRGWDRHPCHARPTCHLAPQRGHQLGTDDLAGSQRRDARRVGRHELGADPPDRVAANGTRTRGAKNAWRGVMACSCSVRHEVAMRGASLQARRGARRSPRPEPLRGGGRAPRRRRSSAAARACAGRRPRGGCRAR